MSAPVATALRSSQVEWPSPEPIEPERVTSGAPSASTLVLEDAPDHQLGLWRVSPGVFRTDHAGYREYIHVIEGRGRLVDELGGVTELEPGTTVLSASGWRGRWEVDETIVKVYTVLNDPAD